MSFVVFSMLAAVGHIKELVVARTLPLEDDDIFFQYPIQIEWFDSDSFVVIEHYGSEILVIGTDGQLIRRLGRMGQGPGEFQNPSGIAVAQDEQRVLVIDQSQARIQIFDFGGHYLSSFKCKEVPRSIAARSGRIYGSFVHPIGGDFIIECRTQDGAIVERFGAPLFPDKHVTPSVNLCELEIYDDHLYVLFSRYPFLRRTTLDGTLVDEFSFDGMKYGDRVPGNFDWHELRPNQQVYPFKCLFRSFAVAKSGIYVGLYDDSLMIDRFHHDGTFVCRYQIHHQEELDFYLHGFLIRDQANDPLFFVLRRLDGDIGIDACGVGS